MIRFESGAALQAAGVALNGALWPKLSLARWRPKVNARNTMSKVCASSQVRGTEAPPSPLRGTLSQET